MNVLSLKHIRGNSFKRAITRFAWFSVILSMILTVRVSTYAQSPPSRPILFVHGFCDNAFGWASLFAANSAFWQNLPAGLYTNQTVYIVEYDSASGALGFWAETNPGYGANSTLNPLVQIPETSIPSSARFFAINFYDPNPQVTNPTDPAVVTDVSVLNKANEISQVLAQIESITGVQQVNIIAHSLGGLDSRAYVENLASTGACYNDTDVNNSYPDYAAASCSPGSVPYRGDIANIITVDTPHAGTPLATPRSGFTLYGIFPSCNASPSTNMNELLPQSLGGAGLIEGLNYDGLGVNTAMPTQNTVPIQAIQDFFTDQPPASDINTSWSEIWFNEDSDDIVARDSQAITVDSYTGAANLPSEDSTSTLQNSAVPYLTTDTTIANTSGCWQGPFQVLHVLSCIGSLTPTQTTITNQLIDDTVPWITSWQVTPTTLNLGSGVSVSYNASDLSANTLTRAELWRAPDAKGVPGTWEEVDSYIPLSGNSYQVSFQDTPPAAGKYWYGTHLFDSGGNEALEPSTTQVTVNPDQGPTVSTGPATAITVNSATLTGTVNPNGLDTKFYFLYGTNSTLSGASQTPSQDLGSGTTASVISANIAGLSTSTYYFRVVASNSSGTNSGNILSFATGSFAPVTTTAATSVTGSAANINGTINPQGANGFWGFEWGTDPTMTTFNYDPCNPTQACNPVTANSTVQSFSVALVGLHSSTTYYYRLGFFNSNSANLQWGAVVSFTTGPPPAVTTTAATSITGSGANINGTINPLGANGFWGFEYGTDPTMTTFSYDPCNPTQACNPVTANSTVQSFSVALVGLHSSTTYYYRLGSYDTDNVNLQWGATLSFTTGPPPTVTTTAATSVTGSGANINGTINPLGANGFWGFEYGTDPTMTTFSYDPCNPTQACNPVTANSTVQSFSVALVGLHSSTTYYYRLGSYDTDNVNLQWGATLSFTTGPPPTVTTTAATSVTGSGANINGTINPLGANGFWGFEYGTDPTMTTFSYDPCNPTQACNPVTANSTVQSFSVALVGLHSSTTYYYRLGSYDTDNVNLQWGATLSFTTGPPPTVTTTAATSVTGSGANINGTINPLGANGFWGFEYGTDPTMTTFSYDPCNPTQACNPVTANSTVQSFSVALVGLHSSTTYYYRLGSYDTDNVNLQWGATLSFTTGPPPTVTTTAATSVTGSGANINGTINPLGANGFWGFEYGTDPTMTTFSYDPCNPTQACNPVTANSTVQSFSVALVGLHSSTTYYYRLGSYDTDNVNLQWGATLSFTTGPPPTVTTTAATSVTGSGANINGTINPLGANGFWGFEYGTDPTMTTFSYDPCNPTQACNPVTANSTVQSFSVALVGLHSSTTYYYRLGSYDTDNVNLQWGAVVSFTTGPPPAVTTTAATSVTGSGANINGTINPQGANGYWGFEYGTDPTMTTFSYDPCNPTQACNPVTASSTVQSFSVALVGLHSSTTYYYRLGSYDTDNANLQWGAVVSFKTTGLSTPTLTVTPSASSITTAQPLTVTVAVSGGSGNPTPTGSVTLTGGGYTSAAVTLSSGSATIDVPANSLSAGTDSLAVSYTPDSSSSSTYNGASGSVTVTVTTPAKTTPTVTVSPSSSSITTAQALSVTVTVAGTPVPTGSVTLSGGGYTSAATTLSGGSATINIPAGSLATGSDTLTANYTPDSNSSSTYNSATATNSVSVIQAKSTPTVTVTPLASSISTAQPLTVTVAVSGGNSNPTPTGSVTLTGGGYTSAAITLSSGSATINVPANSLSAGTDNLVVSYTPDSSSSSTYNGATGTNSVTVTQAKSTPTVTVTPSASSITTAQPLTVTVTVAGTPTPTGSVTLTGGGYTSAATTLSSGSASINIPVNSLSAGSDSLAVSYTPDSSSSSTYNSASGSASVTVTVAAKTTPTVTVTLSASSITTAQPLTVTVSVNGGSGNPTPTGSVTLTGGGYTSGATTLSSGSASINIPVNSLSAGSDSLAVSYTPDSSSSSTYNSATGANSVTVTQAKSTPTVTVTPSASSITTIQALSVTVTVAGTPTPTGSVTLSGGGYNSAATTLTGGSATINIPAGSLSTGTDALTASYTPDSNSSSTYNSASGSNTVTVTTPTKSTPTVTVTPSASSITTTQALSVTVTVAGTPTPTGSVTLSGGGYTSAPTNLSGGSATINITAGSLSTGTDTLTASYTPDSNSSSTYNSASGSATVTVTTPAKTTPTVTVTPSASSITTAQPLTVTVSVNGGTGNPTPTGTVTLSGGGYTSAAATLSSGSTTINIPANSLSAGTDSLAVSYTPDPSSSSTYNSASGSASVTVTVAAKSTPTVAVTPSASSITTAQALTVTVAVSGGTGNPTPTGSVTLTGGGYTSAATTLSGGSTSINIPSNSLSAGTDSLAVTYTPDSSSFSTFNSATGSATVTVTTPTKTTPTVTVTPSASSITTAQPLTVAVSVNGGTGNPTPTGTVTLSSGSYSAQQTLASGTASFNIAAGALGNGANTLTASYSGDATYAVASSTTTVTVEPVSISTTTPSAVNPGSSTTSTLTLTGSGGYSGTMNLSCSLANSPVGAQSLPTCALNPSSVILASGGNGTSTLTVNTTAASTTALARPKDQHLWNLGSGGAVLAALLFFGIPYRRRWTSMLALVLLVAVFGAIGCGGGGGTGGGGGGGSSTPATTAGNYSFTVVAIDSSNAKITTSTTISVTVQ